MRKTLASGITVLLLLASVLALGAQELPDLMGVTITVAVENSYVPFSFIDQELSLIHI